MPRVVGCLQHIILLFKFTLHLWFEFVLYGPFPASSSLFLIFNTVDGKKCCLYKRWSVPMNGFEPRTSSVRSNRSTHWAITTALGLKLFAANALIERILKHFLKNNFSGPTTAPPSLSTPDLLYHHHHVSHSTLPLPSHHSHNHNNSQLNHATAAATLNRDQY